MDIYKEFGECSQVNNKIKWIKTNNLVSKNIIYETFSEAIRANVDSRFMCVFEKDNVIYIASPNTLDSYPKELLNSIESAYVWSITSD